MVKGKNSAMVAPNVPTVHYSNGTLQIFSVANQSNLQLVLLYGADGRVVAKESLIFEGGQAQWTTKLEPGTNIVKVGETSDLG